jgi:hypothetical protein
LAHDYDHDPGKLACAWDDPAAMERVVTGLAADAHTVLEPVAGLDLDEPQAEAVGLLALIAGQDVEQGRGRGAGGSHPAPPRVPARAQDRELPGRVQGPCRR